MKARRGRRAARRDAATAAATVLAGGRGGRCAAALDAGGRLLALGNGGSATDAIDVVADFVAPPAAVGWPPRPAIDLTADTAILTAIANDIGTEAIFARQVIAYGRAGDVLLALSTSGSSLQRARRAGRGAPAGAGDDRAGRLRRRPDRRRAARRPRGRHARRSTSRGSRRRRRPPTTCCASWSSGGVEPRDRRTRDRGAAGARPRAGRPGTVQGVGFRPFVYRLAHEARLAGYVLNDERGVLLEVEGARAASSTLLRPAARRGAAAGAWSSRVAREPAAAERRARLRDPSTARARAHPTRRSPPTPPPASDCLAELLDPADRRYRYPFINCTNCGPRFTIVRGVPYDRPLTTMAPFAMCADCRREYEDPRDRRFHAQPNACPVCGPALRCSTRRRRRRSPTRDGRGSRASRRRARRAVRDRRASRGSAAITSPATRPTSARSRRCARASTARTSRSR